jgi:ATP-binding protein involved in chromosome partitioning
VADPEGPVARRYREIALRMSSLLALKAKDYSSRFPTISVVSD